MPQDIDNHEADYPSNIVLYLKQAIAEAWSMASIERLSDMLNDNERAKFKEAKRLTEKLDKILEDIVSAEKQRAD